MGSKRPAETSGRWEPGFGGWAGILAARVRKIATSVFLVVILPGFHKSKTVSMKSKLIIAFMLMATCPCTAQSNPGLFKEPERFVLEFGGAVGVFMPITLEKQTAAYKNGFTGSNAVTYLQLTYRSRYFAKFSYGQTTVAYRSLSETASGRSVIDAKANTNNIGLSLGYRRQLGKWAPYVMAGSGIALVDVPSVSYDFNAGQSVYSTKSRPYYMVTAGAGIDYKVGKYFVPFAEGQLSMVPAPSAASLTHLSGVSILIGIKASLF